MNSPKEVSKEAAFPTEENREDIETKEWPKISVMKDRDEIPAENSVLPRLETLIPAMSSPGPFARHNGGPTKKRFRLDEEEYDSLDSLTCNFTSEMVDDCDAFGRHIAAQLRLMNKMQKFIAQRLISEVCFRGQIQHLQLTTNLTHTPTYQTTQLQSQVYSSRPSQGFAARPQDYMRDHKIAHPQPIRHPIPLSSSGVANAYPNPVQQQSDHLSESLGFLQRELMYPRTTYFTSANPVDFSDVEH